MMDPGSAEILPDGGFPEEGLPKTIVFGGEALDVGTARRWARRTRLVAAYGPTETSVCASACAVDPDDWPEHLLGFPIGGAEIRILRPDKTRAGVWEPGEIHIAGPGVADGYLGGADADRFADLGWGRCFATRDRAVLREDGRIAFLGRMDRQVKVRGQLAEPAELEAVLGGIAGVRRAAAAPRRTRTGWVLDAHVEGTASEEDVKTACLALPTWLRPARVFLWDALLETASGKPDAAGMEGVERSPEPLEGDEAAVAALIERVLGLDPGSIGRSDSFLGAGGDSLSSILLALEAEALDLPVDVQAACAGADVSELAASMRSAAARGGRKASEFDAWCEPGERLESAWASPKIPLEDPDARVLLTGATGLVGSHVLSRLLQDLPGAEIVCLVQAETDASARERLFESAVRKGARISPAARIRALAGDVEKPGLGLPLEMWRELSETTGRVVHCAAKLSLAATAEDLREANVEGTRRILELAAAGAAKNLLHVSTLSVFVAADEGKGTFLEDDALDGRPLLFGGYAQTKHAAERLASRAPVGSSACVRLGLIVQDGEGEGINYRRQSNNLTERFWGLRPSGRFPAS